MNRQVIAISFIALLATMASGLGKQPEPPFPDQLSIQDDQEPLRLLGEYRYVYRMFFKLYDAALYTPEERSASEVLEAETDFYLTFRYLRKIDKSIILESSAKMLERNLSPSELDTIQDRVDTLNDAYTTVRNGDESALSYEQGVGTTLYINGKAIVTIPGSDFAKLYFKIWLGERGLSESLRESLLGSEI